MKRSKTEPKKGSPPYMRFWVERWLSSSRINAMSPLAELSYFRLILWSWQSGRLALAKDDELLARLTRLSLEQFLEVKSEVLNCFEERDGKLWHPKVAEELEHALGVIEKRKDASDSRWRDKKGNAHAERKHFVCSANAVHTGSVSDADADADVDSRGGMMGGGGS